MFNIGESLLATAPDFEACLHVEPGKQPGGVGLSSSARLTISKGNKPTDKHRDMGASTPGSPQAQRER